MQFLFVQVFTFAARSSLDVCVNAPTFVSLVIAHTRSPLAQVLLPARTDRLLTSPRHLNYLTPSYWLRGTRADRSSFSQSLARTYSRCRNGKRGWGESGPELDRRNPNGVVACCTRPPRPCTFPLCFIFPCWRCHGCLSSLYTHHPLSQVNLSAFSIIRFLWRLSSSN